MSLKLEKENKNSAELPSRGTRASEFCSDISVTGLRDQLQFAKI